MKRFQLFFLLYLISFILFFFMYLNSYQKNKAINETPSRFGGYLSDGNYIYCEDLTPSWKQYCREEKTPGLGTQYPWLMKLLYLGIAPLVVSVIGVLAQQESDNF